MGSLLTEKLGGSWRSSLTGLLTGICAFLAFYPDALSILPDYWENLVKQIVAFLVASGIIVGGFVARDKKASEKDKEAAELESAFALHQIKQLKTQVVATKQAADTIEGTTTTKLATLQKEIKKLQDES